MATTQLNGSVPLGPPLGEHYGGYLRFELELEFVQQLANPLYLNHLATQKYFDSEEFVRYLSYLQYWTQPQYLQFLQYPGPTLKALELLQEEQFRKDILVPQVVEEMVRVGFEAAVKGVGR